MSEEHKIFSASTVFFRAGSVPAIRRHASVGPGLAVYQDDIETNADMRSRGGTETPRNDGIISRGREDIPTTRLERRISADSSIFQRDFFSHHENHVTLPTPPYTPAESPGVSGWPTSSSRNSHGLAATSRSDDNPAHTLEEFRNALRALEVEQRSTSFCIFNLSSSNNIPLDPSYPRNDRGRSPLNASSASSVYSFHDTSLSRRHSIEDVPEDQPTPTITPPATSSPSPGDDGRGRKHTRFSFANVSNVLFDAVKDRVRSSSPRMRTERDATISRERGWEGRSRDPSPRGRTVESAKHKEHHHKSSTFSKLLKGDQEKEAGDGWKEFKKGMFSTDGMDMIIILLTLGQVFTRIRSHSPSPETHLPRSNVRMAPSPGVSRRKSTAQGRSAKSCLRYARSF